MPLSGAPDPGFPDATHKEQACSRTPLTRSRARTNAERTLFRVCQLKGQNVWKVVKVRGPTFAVSSIPFNNTNRTQDNETQGCGAFFQKTLAGTIPVGFSNCAIYCTFFPRAGEGPKCKNPRFDGFESDPVTRGCTAGLTRYRPRLI